MTIATIKFRAHNAEQFFESFSEPDASNYYFFIARPYAWVDDGAPPTETNDAETVEYSIYDDMIAMKKITPSDISYVVPRYDWTSGNTYIDYNSNSYIANTQFYVLTTPAYNVYKCLFNNYDGVSTDEPTSVNTSSQFSTSDSYVWKYMYTLSGYDAANFLTTSYLPVKTLTSDDDSLQWDVQQSAVNGSINIINITANGSGYTTLTGTFQTVTNSTTFVLPAGGSGTSNAYTDYGLYISSGAGAGQLRKISAYNGGTKRVTVSTGFSPTPNTLSVFLISPYVNIVGDGTSAQAYSTVSSNTLSTIQVINVGSNYSYANVTISGNTGSGGTAHAVLSPKNGHGSDAKNELFSHSIMLNVKLSGNESNTFTTSNDFRIVGIVKDPRFANNDLATGSSYDMCTKFVLTSTSGTFISDTEVVGQTSGATGKIVESNSTFMRVSSVKGTFSASETILSAGSGGATSQISTITEPTIKKYTGDVIYYENRSPISRAEDQTEFIKLVIRF